MGNESSVVGMIKELEINARNRRDSNWPKWVGGNLCTDNIHTWSVELGDMPADTDRCDCGLCELAEAMGNVKHFVYCEGCKQKIPLDLFPDHEAKYSVRH